MKISQSSSASPLLRRSSALVTYSSWPDGHTFCVNWVDVGYFSQNVDKTDSLRLLITDRNGVGGDVDLRFNYGHISWETGRASAPRRAPSRR